MRLAIACGITLLVACSGPADKAAESPAATQPPATTAADEAASPAARYPIKGKVEAVSADKATVTLDHEEIPGFMAAMKMDYRLSDPSLAAQLKPGDRVTGTLEVRGGDYVLVVLTKQ